MKQYNFNRHIHDIDYKNGNNVIIDGKELLNLSSNDYLSISTDKNLLDEFLVKYSENKEFLFSSASARLLSGTSSVYKKVENTLAEWFKKEACLIFNTGYQCNQGVISALFGKGDVIFSDKLNHASIMTGIKLSGADFYRYKHLDYDHLKSFLKMHRHKYNRALIVSESIYSMDGDIADIDKLIELKKEFNATLMIDEAHGFLVYGENLCGIGEEKDIDIITATFGKALGSEGAFCISSEEIKNKLVNSASSFIFSTAIAPACVMWTDFLLSKKEFLKSQQTKLKNLYTSFGLNSQILPVVIGDTKKCENICEILQSKGYFALPIRPPTVPIGTDRIRLSLCANMEYEDIKKVLEIIEQEK